MSSCNYLASIPFASVTSLFQKCSWINIAASRLSYELGLHGVKKSMETWNITTNRHSEDDSFHTSKSGNFNSLRSNFCYNTYLESD